MNSIKSLKRYTAEEPIECYCCGRKIKKVNVLQTGDLVGDECVGLIEWPTYRFGRKLTKKQQAFFDSHGLEMPKRKKNVLGMSTLVGGLLEDQAVKRGSKFVKAGLKRKHNAPDDPNESVQDKSWREWRENYNKVQSDPEGSSEKDLRRAIGYLDKARHSAIRRAQEKGEKVDPYLLRGFDTDYEYFVSLIKKKEKKHNPAPEAEDLSEKWHGRAPKQTSEVVEIETYEEDLAELADLEELGILTQDLSQYFISFKKDRPKLCAEDENNLIFVGGDQKICTDDVGVVQDGKRLVPLGWCYQIVYETDKHHLEGSNGVSESYEHFFAEEWYKENFDSVDEFKTSDAWFAAMLKDGLVEEAIENGLIPMLVYNKTDQKLILVGGSYTVEDVGIKN